MIALLLLASCAGSAPTTADQPPRFDGYHVDICVVTHVDIDAFEATIFVSQVAGFDVMSNERTEKLVHDGTMQADHWCAKDVVLHAEYEGQAISTHVSAYQNAFKIEKAEVTYRLVPSDGFNNGYFPYTDVRAFGCDGNLCGTIEAKEAHPGEWWFNIIGASQENNIPTAIVNTAR